MISVRSGAGVGAFQRVRVAMQFLNEVYPSLIPDMASYIRSQVGFIESLSLFMMDIKRMHIYRHNSRGKVVIDGRDAPFVWIISQLTFAFLSGNETVVDVTDSHCGQISMIINKLGLNDMIKHPLRTEDLHFDYSFDAAVWPSGSSSGILEYIYPRLSDLVMKEVREWTYLRKEYGDSVTMIMDEFDLLPEVRRHVFVKERTECLLDEVSSTCPFYRDKQLFFAQPTGVTPIRYAHEPLLNGSQLAQHVPPYGTDIIAHYPVRDVCLYDADMHTDDRAEGHGLTESGPVSLSPYNVAFASGGTSGQMKFVYRTSWEDEDNARYLGKGLHAQGVGKDDRVMNFLSSGLWGGMHVFNLALGQTGCGVIPTGPGFPDEDALRLIVQLQPTAILGTPSYILKLAESLEDLRARSGSGDVSDEAGTATSVDARLANVRTVITGGEQLFAGMQEKIEKAFAVQTFLSTGYTSNETGAIGFRCRHLPPTYFHVHENMQHVDIYPQPPQMSTETCGSEMSGIGDVRKGGRHDLTATTHELLGGGSRSGRIVTSNLNRLLMPVISYDIGDSGRIVNPSELRALISRDGDKGNLSLAGKEGVCGCGRRLRVLQLLGRWDDRVRVGAEDVYSDEIAAAIEGVTGLSMNFSVHVYHDDTACRDMLEVQVERIVETGVVSVICAREDEKSHMIRTNTPLLQTQLLDRLATKTRLDWGQRQSSSEPSADRTAVDGDSSGWASEATIVVPTITILDPGCLPRNYRTGKIKRIVDHRVV